MQAPTNFLSAALLLLACFPVLAQVTISNPDHLEVPVEEVNVLFHTTCQVVAEQFNIRGGATKTEFPLLLVLGATDERYTEDEEHQQYTIYLKRWNAPQFAASTLRLAIQRVVPRSRAHAMVKEILRRSNQIAPVSVHTFRVQP